MAALALGDGNTSNNFVVLCSLFDKDADLSETSCAASPPNVWGGFVNTAFFRGLMANGDFKESCLDLLLFVGVVDLVEAMLLGDLSPGSEAV